MSNWNKHTLGYLNEQEYILKIVKLFNGFEEFTIPIKCKKLLTHTTNLSIG